MTSRQFWYDASRVQLLFELGHLLLKLHLKSYNHCCIYCIFELCPLLRKLPICILRVTSLVVDNASLSNVPCSLVYCRELSSQVTSRQFCGLSGEGKHWVPFQLMKSVSQGEEGLRIVYVVSGNKRWLSGIM